MVGRSGWKLVGACGKLLEEKTREVVSAAIGFVCPIQFDKALKTKIIPQPGEQGEWEYTENRLGVKREIPAEWFRRIGDEKDQFCFIGGRE